VNVRADRHGPRLATSLPRTRIPLRDCRGLLYLRGEHEGGDIDAYIAGFRGAGLADVRSAIIAGAGHFAPEDAPDAVWEAIADFISTS